MSTRLDVNGKELHVGDIVVCVESDSMYGLAEGQEYIIDRFRDDYNQTDIYVNGIKPSWMTNKFALVEPTVKQSSREIYYTVEGIRVDGAEQALRHALVYARKGEVPTVTKTTVMETTEEL